MITAFNFGVGKEWKKGFFEVRAHSKLLRVSPYHFLKLEMSESMCFVASKKVGSTF